MSYSQATKSVRSFLASPVESFVNYFLQGNRSVIIHAVGMYCVMALALFVLDSLKSSPGAVIFTQLILRAIASICGLFFLFILKMNRFLQHTIIFAAIFACLLSTSFVFSSPLLLSSLLKIEAIHHQYPDSTTVLSTLLVRIYFYFLIINKNYFLY